MKAQMMNQNNNNQVMQQNDSSELLNKNTLASLAGSNRLDVGSSLSRLLTASIRGGYSQEYSYLTTEQSVLGLSDKWLMVMSGRGEIQRNLGLSLSSSICPYLSKLNQSGDSSLMEDIKSFWHSLENSSQAPAPAKRCKDVSSGAAIGDHLTDEVRGMGRKPIYAKPYFLQPTSLLIAPAISLWGRSQAPPRQT